VTIFWSKTMHNYGSYDQKILKKAHIFMGMTTYGALSTPLFTDEKSFRKPSMLGIMIRLIIKFYQTKTC